MENQKIIESLSPIERKVLPILSTQAQDLDEISKKTETDKTTALRAVQFLKNKKLAETIEKQKKIIQAGLNGLYYLKKQLPERRLLNKLGEKKTIPFHEIRKICSLNKDEAKAAIGVLKRKAVISISSNRVLLRVNKHEIVKKMLEELLLEKLPIEAEKLEPQDKLALQNLKSRKNIIEIIDKKEISAKLTELGNKISKMNLDKNLIEQLTPKIIKTNSWKTKKFRRYDLTSQPPKIYGGKRHFTNQAAEYAKKIWLEMGFKEMTGSLVQTSFWNFDALFTAQDHPVREMHDTFFIKNIRGKLPKSENKNQDIVEEVKKVHEGGEEIAGGKSRGWQEEWKEENAEKVLLRTHTTALSAQTLYKIAQEMEKNIPAKYFALGKCFRNETVDWSHSFEFNQTEGIVVDENANFRQLLGYLKEFYKKMGYEKIKFQPAYFPYTEPSVEVVVWHPEKKVWLELGGAGMFRPELTTPFFGKHIPVLAWGQGMERIIMTFLEIKDLREMYENNLNKLRNMKFWLK
jgi:phenylalanyl-tRNA synthetase alpha chain